MRAQKQEPLFSKLVRKHDWVWNQKARWPLEIRKVVCQRLWEAAIRERERESAHVPETRTSRIAFPRISIEVLKESLSEMRNRDNAKATALFLTTQPYVMEYVVQASCSVDEAAMRLSAMELFCRALQLQMERGA